MPSGSDRRRAVRDDEVARSGDLTLAADDVEADDAVAVDHRAHVDDVGAVEADARDVVHVVAHLALDRASTPVLCGSYIRRLPVGRSS